MSTSIRHNSRTHRLLQDGESPEVQCFAGDFFISHGTEGYWVNSWDGHEALAMCACPAASIAEAELWAKECAEA